MKEETVNEKNSEPLCPESESLRCQLTELNNRSRWYSSELWHIPFAYLGVTGVSVTQLAVKGKTYLGVGCAGSALFGVFVLIHIFRIRAREQRAIMNLQDTERALGLPVTVKTGLGHPKIFQIALVVAVAAYAIAALFFVLQKQGIATH